MFSTKAEFTPVFAPEGSGGAPDADALLYPDDTQPGPETGQDEGGFETNDYLPPEDDGYGEDEPEAEDLDDDELAEAARFNTVPEDGVYDLAMPEGVAVDEKLLAELGPEFSALQLSNGEAQGLVDKYIAVTARRQQEMAAQWAQTTAGWADQARRDPEIGGVRWDRTVSTAAGVAQRFGTPELHRYLQESGGGNHPELIRLLAKVGALIGEDNPAINDEPGKAAKGDATSVLYPDDQPKGK